MNGNVTQGPAIISPTFSPVAMPPVEPIRAAGALPIYDRRPRSTDFTWETAEEADEGGGFYTLSIARPTVIRVIRTQSNLTAPLRRVRLDLFWRPHGEKAPMDAGDFYGSGPVEKPRRGEFYGPYAYLGEPGTYEIVGVTDVSIAPETIVLLAEQIVGVTPDEWLALVTAPGGRGFDTSNGTLAPGGEAHLSLFYIHAFPLYRSITVQNTGAVNNLSVILGVNTTAAVVVAPGATLELGPEYLSRQTVTVSSTGGTTYRSLFGLW
ncbi:MAG: hypothetical protein ACREKH_11310 [Candidatus Rokuibacteriota bacterium]